MILDLSVDEPCHFAWCTSNPKLMPRYGMKSLFQNEGGIRSLIALYFLPLYTTNPIPIAKLRNINFNRSLRN